MELETAPAKDDDWLIVNVQGTSHTASTNKHISCTICNVLHAVIHIEQFEHLFSFFFDAILLYIQIMQTSLAIISAWMHASQSSPIWYLGLLNRLF